MRRKIELPQLASNYTNEQRWAMHICVTYLKVKRHGTILPYLYQTVIDKLFQLSDTVLDEIKRIVSNNKDILNPKLVDIILKPIPIYHVPSKTLSRRKPLIVQP